MKNFPSVDEIRKRQSRNLDEKRQLIKALTTDQLNIPGVSIYFKTWGQSYPRSLVLSFYGDVKDVANVSLKLGFELSKVGIQNPLKVLGICLAISSPDNKSYELIFPEVGYHKK